MLSSHSYQEGSLHVDSFDQALRLLKLEVLPKVVEIAWENSEKEFLCSVATSIVGHKKFTLHTVYQKASAITVGGFLLASSPSRFTTKTRVMALHPDHPDELHFLAKIESFCSISVTDNINNQCKQE